MPISLDFLPNLKYNFYRITTFERRNMNSRKLMYIAIVVMCVIAVVLAVYLQSGKQPSSNRNTTNNVKTEESQETLKKEFDQMFNNVVELNDYDTSNIKKLDSGKNIVYTAYSSEAKEDNKYELDINIPVINIDNKVAAEFNSITQELFANKTAGVIDNAKAYTIYSISYTGYINGDILSVIIKSTLKEGSNAQRTIVETYNYNLKTEKSVSIFDVLSEKNITQDALNSKVNTVITNAIKDANKIQLTGYETYSRDINSDIYNIENIETFFFGEDGSLYVLFPYGNNKFTSEMDIVKF